MCILAVNQLLMVCIIRVGKFKHVANKQLDYSGRRELLFTKMLLNVLLKMPEASYMGCLWKVTNCSIDQILFTIRANGFNQCEFLLQTIQCRKEVIITVNCFCWCTRLGLRSYGDCLMYVAVKFLVCNGSSTSYSIFFLFTQCDPWGQWLTPRYYMYGMQLCICSLTDTNVGVLPHPHHRNKHQQLQCSNTAQSY